MELDGEEDGFRAPVGREAGVMKYWRHVRFFMGYSMMQTNCRSCSVERMSTAVSRLRREERESVTSRMRWSNRCQSESWEASMVGLGEGSRRVIR